MQEANVGSWSRESQISTVMLESIRGLNYRFLDCMAASASVWKASQCAGLPGEVFGRVAPLTALQKRAAASCPYALFDLRFHDHDHWQARLRPADQWIIADESAADAYGHPAQQYPWNFVEPVLFFAWHVASTKTLAAQLLLGMTEATAAAFRNASIDCLPALARTESVHLTARWNTCPAYWSALAGAASRPNSTVLRRVQLYGLQLAAAAQLG